MKNKARNAGVAIAAMMAATTFGSAAHAVTVLPPSATINFGQVQRRGQSAATGIGFSISPATFFIPSVNGLGANFENDINPLTCNLSSTAWFNFVFKPTTLGPISTIATVKFSFGATSINSLVTLTGIGVVPIPAHCRSS